MGRSPCCDKNGLKKGPWTPEEDNKLIQYIHVHGPGNWRILPQNAGLQRCPKSCRLRWTNYLRPDIKRGRFSFEEEEAIIQLHSVLGNKWSAIAARLPGRTDNEIKNYWNTHIRKRLLKMGIDPVTHAPRLDLLDLSSLLNSSHINLSNLLRLQTLINPEALGLALNLLSSNNDQNPINDISLQNPHQLPIQTPVFQHHNQFEDLLSQQIPSSSLTFQDQSQSFEGYIGHFPTNDPNTNSQTFHDCLASTTTISESDLFFCGVSDQIKGADLSENSSFSSVLSTPLSSPAPPLDSGSTFMSGSSENERGSFCSNLLRFEIPESLDLDDFM